MLLGSVLFFGMVGNMNAGEWFAGVESGYIEHKFTPEYSFAWGGRDSQFTNRSDGIELGLVAGYEFPVAERFSIIAQLRGAWNNSEFTLYLPSEPARFKYNNPFTLGFGIQPTFQLTEKLGLFADLGLSEGRFNEEKISSSSTRSSYDFGDWVFGYAVGGGLRYQFSESLEGRLSYRKMYFDDFAYRSYLPSGRHVESIRDEPESQAFSLALIFRF